MANGYPRVFVPNLSFSTIGVTLGATPGPGNVESVDGVAPSNRRNLNDIDPALRFVSAGTDAANGYTWIVTATAAADQRVGAVASLYYFSSAQTLAVALRTSADVVLETVNTVRAQLVGVASLRVVEASVVRTIRNIRYQFVQPVSRRTVLGFVVPGLVDQLTNAPVSVVERQSNLPVVVDPFNDLVDRGTYGRFAWVLRFAEREDAQRVAAWERAGVVLCEVSRGVWRLGRIVRTRVDRFGSRQDVSFEFVERLLGRSY